MNFFKSKPEKEVLLVEVQPHLNIVEDVETMESLNSHPGFQMLLQRLRLQKSLLRAKLEQEAHADIRHVDQLQIGMQWLSYLEDTVNKLVTKRKKPEPISLSDSVRTEFDKIMANISSVS